MISLQKILSILVFIFVQLYKNKKFFEFSKSSQEPSVLFSIYKNNAWTIRCLVDVTSDPAIQRIILKIVGFFTVQSIYCGAASGGGTFEAGFA